MTAGDGGPRPGPSRRTLLTGAGSAGAGGLFFIAFMKDPA
jgi:hypothetical protein